VNRVLFTQDNDFLAVVRYRQQYFIHFSGVIYAHQAIISIGECVKDSELIANLVKQKTLKKQCVTHEFSPRKNRLRGRISIGQG
jgi:hypothetical protein